MQDQLTKQKKTTGGALKAAFPHTIAVMTGYLFMGAAFGILLASQGYSFLWAGLMSITIFAGSMQFVAVNLLAGPFAPLSAFIMTLMVNARHIFYGFSMLDKYKNVGRARGYLMFGLTDETFSLLCSIAPPPGINRTAFYLSVTFLNHCYWITGCIAGGLLGAGLSFNVQGIDFVMTALFVAIFTEQWRQRENRLPALTGLFGSAICLAIFGPSHFILPAMGTLVAALTFGRPQLEKELVAHDHH